MAHAFHAVVLQLMLCIATAMAAAPTSRPATQPAGRTVLAAHVDTPLGVGQNIVWCASLQIAWDELRRWNGADLLLADNPPAAVGLAAGHFPRAWAGDADLVAEAGLASEGVRQRIEQQMRQKFGDDHDAPLLQTLRDVPVEVGAYAYLRKRLQFATPFEAVEALGFTFTRSVRTTRMDDGQELTVLDEEERVVRAFGVESLQPDSPPQRRVAEQVRVLWYMEGQWGMQSYGIELLAPGEDRIIFAMLDFDVYNARAGWTLQHAVDRSLHRMRTAAMLEIRVDARDRLDAWFDLLHRMGLDKAVWITAARQGYANLQKSSRLLTDEVLVVPMLDLDITRDFEELARSPFRAAGGKLDGRHLDFIRQRVALTLDEQGVKLDSEAAIGLFGDQPRAFTFDRPFLVLLMRKDAPRPYFAAWIGNTDFMKVQRREKAAPGEKPFPN